MSTELKVVPRYKTLRSITRFLENPVPVLMEYVENYGDTFGYYVGGKQYAILSVDPEVNRHVLQTNHRNYKKSFILTDVLGKYVGHGLLTSNGDYWLRQRRMIQPGFHRGKLQAISGIMVDVMEDFMTKLEASMTAENTTVVMDEKMMELAFDMVAKSLFTTSADEKTLKTLADHTTSIQEFVTKQIRQPFLNPWFQVSGKVKKHLGIANETHQIMLEIIRERKESGVAHDDLLDMLLSAKYEDTGEGMNEKQLMEESLILFVAGHETTANALTWIFYLLTQHPDVVDKLRAEFEEQLGDRPPAFEDFRNLPYTTQVIEEAMRMYPPAWTTDRVAIEDDEINGLKIPKGTIVMNFIYGAHHHPKYWDSPEEFRPERFEKTVKKQQKPFMYFPFGGGPRLCIGNSFSMMEMQLILAQMLRKFDLRLVPDQTIAIHPMITVRPKYPIKIELVKRKVAVV